MSVRHSALARGVILVRAVISAGLILYAHDPSAAQQPAPVDLSRASKQPGDQIATRHLTVATSVRAAEGAGGRLMLFADVTPKPKMHVYAPDQKDYIPITLMLVADDAIRAQSTQYPKAEKFFFEPLKETQLVYSKPFRIVQPVTLAPTARGAVTIKGTLRYQACDDAICYVPQNVPLSWTVAVKR
jgi:hypothetical protein